MCEDWEAPARILEIQEAISNYMAVWHALWPIDPSPLVIHKLMINVNYGAHGAEDEKGRAR